MKENKVKNFKQKNIAISTKLGLTAIAFAATSGIAHAAPPSFDVDLVDTYSTTMNNEKFKDLADAQLKNEIRLSKLYYLMKAQGDGTMTDAEYWSMVDQLLKPSDVVAADGTGSYSLYSQTSDIGAQVSASPYVLIGTGSKIRIVAGSGVDTDGDGQFDQYTPDFEDVKSGTIGGKTYDYAGGYSSGMVSFGDNTATADDGSIGTYRTLTNMAAGRVTAESTDGINGSQLYATNLAVDDLADTVGKGTNFIGGDAGSIAKNIQLGDTLAMSGDTNIGVISDANGMHITLKPNVTADSFTAGGVSISKTGVNAGGLKVTNVANGEVSPTSKDAVNGSQLDATNTNVTNLDNFVKGGINFMGGDAGSVATNVQLGGTLSILGDSNIGATSDGLNMHITLNPHVTADSFTAGVVSISKIDGINAGDLKVTHVADGDISATSTDAVNGSQLHATNTNVTNLDNFVKGGINFTGDNGTTNIQLGDGLSIVGDDNLTTSVVGNELVVALNPDVTANSFTAGNVSFNTTGINAGNFKVVNVADGEVSVDSKDAVNGSQLYQTELNLTTIINQGLNFVDNQGTRVNRKFGEDLGLINTDGNISTKFIGNNLSIDLGKDIKVDSVNVGDTVVINNGGINAGDTKITNVADGEVSSTSKDAVNGSQLNEVKQALDGGLTFATENGEVTKKLGETLELSNKDGNLDITVGPKGDIVFDLNKDIKVDTVTADTVNTNNLHVGDVVINGDGINAGDTKITNVADGTISADSKDAVNGSQLYEVKNHVDTVLGQGIGFADKDGNTTNTKLGETFTITNTDNNITTKVSDGQISIDLADNVKVNESINVGGVVNISKDGINAGDTKITNIADGTISADSKDAVNGSQLHQTNTNVTNLTDKVNKGMNFADKDGNTTNMQLGDTFKITNTDNNLTTKVSDGQVSIDLASEIKVDKVTTGNVSISKDGVDAGGKKVIHVADGDISQNSTDAVNGSQLHQTNQNIKNLGDKVEENRKVSSQGIASVAAMDIEYPEQKPGQWATGVGVGHYDGEQAVAVGVNFLSENGKYKVGASYGQALGSGSKPAAKASLGWVW